MSIGAVPPEEVKRLRSMENRRVLMATWEGFLHRRQAFPVHAAIVAVEQAGAGQRPTAGAHRAEAPTLAGLGLEESDVLAGDAALDADAAADDHAIHCRGVVGTGVGVICRPSLAQTWRPSRLSVCQR